MVWHSRHSCGTLGDEDTESTSGCGGGEVADRCINVKIPIPFLRSDQLRSAVYATISPGATCENDMVFAKSDDFVVGMVFGVRSVPVDKHVTGTGFHGRWTGGNGGD